MKTRKIWENKTILTEHWLPDYSNDSAAVGVKNTINFETIILIIISINQISVVVAGLQNVEWNRIYQNNTQTLTCNINQDQRIQMYWTMVRDVRCALRKAHLIKISLDFWRADIDASGWSIGDSHDSI